MPQRSGVYLILHFASGKAYVGSSLDVSKRIYLHKRMLRLGTHHSLQLQRTFDRDGEGAFLFSVIERCAPEHRVERENVWINYRRACDSRFGYNVRPAGDTREGIAQPPDFADIMRRANTGRVRSAETRAKMSAAAKGRVKSDEHKQKLREAASRQWSDPIARAAAADKQKGKAGTFKGRKHTPEAIEAMRRAHQARYAEKPRAPRKHYAYKKKEGPHLKTGPKPGTSRGDLRRFTDDQVRAIRALWHTKSLAKIGADFGIDAATVHSIVHRKTYADVAEYPALSDAIEDGRKSDMVVATEAPSQS